MRAVVQRVDQARVYVEEVPVAAIGRGLLVFLGVEEKDTEDDARQLAEKIVYLRIFEDGQGKMNFSLPEAGGELLVVSQFTLLGDCRKGRRPSFGRAEKPEPAKDLYERFLEMAGGFGVRAVGGVFQAVMKVDLVNDGPVTILLDTRHAL